MKIKIASFAFSYCWFAYKNYAPSEFVPSGHHNNEYDVYKKSFLAAVIHYHRR